MGALTVPHAETIPIPRTWDLRPALRPISDLRNEYKDAFLKKHGVKLGFMSAFVKASAVALQEIPQVRRTMARAYQGRRTGAPLSVGWCGSVLASPVCVWGGYTGERQH